MALLLAVSPAGPSTNGCTLVGQLSRFLSLSYSWQATTYLAQSQPFNYYCHRTLIVFKHADKHMLDVFVYMHFISSVSVGLFIVSNLS